MKRHFYISLVLLFGTIMSALPQSMIISGGNDHGMVICSEGYIYGWGNNAGNRLGLAAPNNTVTTVGKPEKVNTPAGATFSQVTAGSGSHTLALSCNGIVYAWGDNQQRQCGQATGNVVSAPTPVPCGAAPGYNLDGTSPGPYLGGVKYVCGSTSGSFAILNDGRAVGWGGNGDGGGWVATATPNPFFIRTVNATNGPILQDVIHIGTGDNNIYFLVDPDGDGLGDLYSMGNWNGRGGDGAASAYFAAPVQNGESTPPNQPLRNIKMAIGMDVGGFAVDGITGYVYGWGNGGWGCANGLPGNQTTTVARRIASGMYKTISGEDYLTDVIEVVGGNGYGAAVTKEGYVLYWGNNNPTGAGGVFPNGNTGSDACATGPQFAVYCTGVDVTSVVNPANPLANPNIVKDAVRLSRGDLFGFMVNDKNDFYVWGRNASPNSPPTFGTLGIGRIDEYAARCLRKMTIPCEIPDQCPEAYMVGPLYKCPESSITLFSGFTTPVGNDTQSPPQPLSDRYYFRWYYNGNLLNTTTKNSPVADRRADIYNKTEITVNKAGTYKVEIEYIDNNVPCEACKIVTATVEVINKEMPVDALIVTSCVADPLLPKVSDVICFEFNSKYATGAKPIPSEFEVYTNATSGTPLSLVGGNTLVSIPANNPLGAFCVTGEKIASKANGGVVENIGQDTLYTIWIEDKTKEKGALGVSATTGGEKDPWNLIATIVEVRGDIILQSLDVVFRNADGNTNTWTVAPIIYQINGNNVGVEVGRGTATPITFTANQAATKVTLSFGPNGLPLSGNTVRGTKYIVSLISTGGTNGLRFIPQTFAAASNVDNLDGSTLIRVEGKEVNGGTGSNLNNTVNNNLFSNLVFSKLSSYDCGRIKLTSRYWCPPCITPDIVNGKHVEISVPTSANKVGNVINLCNGESVVLTANQLKYLGGNATNQFDILWYQAASEALATTPLRGPTNAGTDTYTVSAWTLSSPNVAETKRYYVKVQDHNKPTSTSCWKWDYVDIKVNPKPVVPTITIPSFCEGTTPPSIPPVPGYTVTWYNDGSPTPLPGAPNIGALAAGNHTYQVTVTDNTTTCVSDKSNVTVKVEANPLKPADGTITYKREDANASNQFDNILVQDGKSATPVIVQDPTNFTLEWSTSATGPWSATVPTIPDYIPGDTQDKTYTFYVRRVSTSTAKCVSSPGTITVRVYLTPAPTPHPVSYCEGEIPTDPLTADKDLGTYTDAQIQLRWYVDNNPATLPLPSAPIPFGGTPATPGTTTYYVSQFNSSNGSESSRVPLVVTVYSKPVLSVTPIAPVCDDKTIDITKGTVWSVTDNNNGELALNMKYFDTDGTTELSNPTNLSGVGINTYYIQALFTMPSNKGGDAYCASGKKSVQVNIQDLSVSISGSEDACPINAVTPTNAVNLTAVPATNNNAGPITYRWLDEDGNPLGSASTFNTGNMTGPKGSTYTYNLTITQGACTADTTHTIKIGDGPIVGNMTVSETGNSYSPTVFAPNDVKKFYSCGGDVTISVAYDGDQDYVWTNSLGRHHKQR